MLLPLRREHFDASNSRRKLWEGRPIYERRKDGSFKPWRLSPLLTLGRRVLLQSGTPPLLEMRIVDIRYFYSSRSNPRMTALGSMVMELGNELLPDISSPRARMAVYHEYYGPDLCARGFVAMKLDCLESSTYD